jgi:hypothetical protein
VRFVKVLAVVTLLVGCSQAAPSVERQHNREAPERIENAPTRDPSTDLPAYDVTSEQDCAESGVVGKCYGISSDATSREELEVLTADLWLDSPGYLAVLVTFYPNKPTADASAAGFAFENEQAARVVLAQFLAQGTSVEDEVGETMANGGIYLVVRADEARELNQKTALGCAGEAPAEAVVASSSPSATRLRRSPQPQVPSTSLSPPHTRGRDTREQSGPTRRGEDAARSSAPRPSEPPYTERRVCRYRCGGRPCRRAQARPCAASSLD